MKKKLFFSGIISILLIFTFLAGCDNGTTNEVKVTEYVPSPYPSAVPTEVPIEVPGQTYGALARALLDAQEAYVKDPTQRPVVTITGQIPIQANSTVTVPDYVTLQINKGARLTIEANAILFVREFAKVNVQGELYFEQYANGDDVRQAKLVGEIVADGGTIYDKSSAGHLLQYVDKVREGGRLVFAGGTTTIAGKKETNLLGTPTFTGDGYIKLVFSDGWSKYNPVVVAAATDNIVSATPVAPIPRLRGFEVIGKVQVTGGEMVIPDSATNALDFVVKKGSELTIDAGASLMSEGTTAANVVKFVIEEGASLNVDGRFYIPTGATARASLNYGTVTVSGTLVSDLTLTTVATLTGFAQSNVIFKPGSSILYDRRLSGLRFRYS